ncbi:MAG: SRPBCC family protein [Flavobacteriales bacterium]|nr:SRPBCC family protein [Flavobacteriales bacterium]
MTELQPITITASVAATPQKAWECYTDPAHVIGWNFASDDWHCPSASTDLRAGGRFVARMEAKDGSFGFDFEGIYTQVEPQRSLGYVLADGRNVSVSFRANGDATTVTVTFDPETENSIELQRQGWQAILDNYARYAGGC